MSSNYSDAKTQGPGKLGAESGHPMIFGNAVRVDMKNNKMDPTMEAKDPMVVRKNIAGLCLPYLHETVSI